MSIDHCAGVEERLSALLDGELSRPEAEAARDHARGCSRCGAVLRDLQAVSRTLRAWDRSAPPVPVSVGFRDRLRERLREAPAAPHRRHGGHVPVGDRAIRRPLAGLGTFVGAGLAAAAVTVLALATSLGGDPGVGPRRVVAGADPGGSGSAHGGGAVEDVEALLRRAADARARGDDEAHRRALLRAVALAPADRRVEEAVGEAFGFDLASPADALLGAGEVRRASSPWSGSEDGAAPAAGDRYQVGPHRFDSLEAYEAWLEARESSRRLEMSEAARRAAAAARPEVVSVATARNDGDPASPLAAALGRLVAAGPAVSVDGLTVFPLRSDAPPADVAAAGLEESLRERRIEVRDDPSRRDPRTVLVSHVRRDEEPVLLLAGEVLAGGRIDRMIARDVLVPAGAVDVPVSVVPVEVGRRGAARLPQSRFDAVAGVAGPSLRGLAVAHSTPEEMDGAVRRTLDALHVVGLHRSLAEAFSERTAGPVLRQARRRVQTLLAALAPPDVTAFAVARGAEFLGIEVFGSHDLVSRHGERLLVGYALEAGAAGRADGVPREVALVALLADAAAGRPFGASASTTGPGTECGLVAADGTLLGSGVLVGGRVLHASLVGGAGPAAVAARDGRTAGGAAAGGTPGGPGGTPVSPPGVPEPGGEGGDDTTVPGTEPPRPAGGPTER